MNIYLLHVGYVIGVLAVSLIIAMLTDEFIYGSLIMDSKSEVAPFVYWGLIATVLLLLSYY